MFTGIVTDVGEVLAITPRAEGLHRLKIACGYDRASIVDGASIACNGVCLTVVGTGEEDGRTWFAVDTAAETLAVTTAGRWQHGTRLNLERALKVGDELGGHMMAGRRRACRGCRTGHRLIWRVLPSRPPAFACFIAQGLGCA